MQNRTGIAAFPRLRVGLAIGFMATLLGCRLEGEGASSTVAPDRRSIPPGRTIPAAGFGVDLVKTNERAQTIGSKQDATILPVKAAD